MTLAQALQQIPASLQDFQDTIYSSSAALTRATLAPALRTSDLQGKQHGKFETSR